MTNSSDSNTELAGSGVWRNSTHSASWQDSQSSHRSSCDATYSFAHFMLCDRLLMHHFQNTSAMEKNNVLLISSLKKAKERNKPAFVAHIQPYLLRCSCSSRGGVNHSGKKKGPKAGQAACHTGPLCNGFQEGLSLIKPCVSPESFLLSKKYACVPFHCSQGCSCDINIPGRSLTNCIIAYVLL